MSELQECALKMSKVIANVKQEYWGKEGHMIGHSDEYNKRIIDNLWNTYIDWIWYENK